MNIMLELRMHKFKEILEKKMKDKGYNRRSLALACGLQEFAIQSIIAGKSLNPRIDTMEKIADIFNCSIDELYGRSSAGFVPIEDIELWVESIERVEAMILESKKDVDVRTRASLYLAYYEFNSQGIEIKNTSQLDTLMRFKKNTSIK